VTPRLSPPCQRAPDRISQRIHNGVAAHLEEFAGSP
jgi:hypothetical protein